VNLLYGKIVDLACEDGSLRGRVRVGGALKKITLDLLTDPLPGDTVLVCEGIALGKVDPSKENPHVSRHSR
jgi:hydrogenase maturation factor